jgi:hypothetical protein
MALSRNLQVLEISGLRLDQILGSGGRLSPSEAQLVSEARFLSAQRAFQTALDRHVDLVVLHSEILSGESAGGRAPWFLSRLIDGAAQQGIAVVWVENQHNPWMERFVTAPPQLIRLVPGDVRRIETNVGAVLFQAGRAATQPLQSSHEWAHFAIGLDCGTQSRLDLDRCDLMLHTQGRRSDQIEDFIAAAQAGHDQPLATLHLIRADRSHSSESLPVSPLGFMRVACSLSGKLAAGSLVEHLGEEVDAAAGQYFANSPQVQMLVVDLKVTGHGPAWDSLWSPDSRESLVSDINHRSRHPGCHLRAISAVADSIEVSRPCPYTPVIDAIWTETTARSSQATRSLADLAPESITLGDWSRHELIPMDHALAPEVRHACLHQLRSAS